MIDLRILIFGWLALAVAVGCEASGLDEQRGLFVQVDKLLSEGRHAEAREPIERLKDYPLYPYLRYRWLAQNLGDHAAVQGFLDQYHDRRQAGPLRAKWLERLASEGLWDAFLKAYQGSDDPALRCDFHLAQHAKGRRSEAFKGAAELWLTGDTLPASCVKLFDLWRKSGGLSSALNWRRYALAVRKNNTNVMTSLVPWISDNEIKWVETWRQVHAEPQRVLSCQGWDFSSPVSSLIFADGVEQLAKTQPAQAEAAWHLNKVRLPLDDALKTQTDGRLALALATSRSDRAGAYLAALGNDGEDGSPRAWRLRAALIKQDWPGVIAAYAALRDEEQRQSEWRYWHGRALEAVGEGETARDVFSSLARERDFYGFLAADKSSMPYALATSTFAPPAAELDRIAGLTGFRMVREWRALDRSAEAKAEWLHALKSLTRPDQVLAAKLAQAWNWDQMAMMSAVKAGYWDDLSLRFPTAFSQSVAGQGQLRQIDSSLLFGIIRRESGFDPLVGSPAGAQGLMQLMPATAEQMAQRLNEKLPGANALLDPDRNVRLGSAYFRGLLDRFSGQTVLAIAAYNAGPNNVDRWLPAKSSLPADIWIETVPFVETRQYVKAVLTNQAIYRYRFEGEAMRLSSALSIVAPGPKAQSQAERVDAVPLCE